MIFDMKYNRVFLSGRGGGGGGGRTLAPNSELATKQLSKMNQTELRDEITRLRQTMDLQRAGAKTGGANSVRYQMTSADWARYNRAVRLLLTRRADESAKRWNRRHPNQPKRTAAYYVNEAMIRAEQRIHTAGGDASVLGFEN